MDLHPERSIFKDNIVCRGIGFMPLNHYEMFIEAPWLVKDDLIHISSVIEDKKDFVVTKVTNFETICRPLQLLERSRNSIHN